MKKCKKCGAPLEGFLYNTIGKLMGIKPSASDPEICNKCVEEKKASSAEATEAKEEKAEETPKAEEKTPAVEAPATPEPPAEEKKEESI